jgi:hypothetical protein
MTRRFNPSPELMDYAMQVLEVVEQVTGTPRFAVVNGRKCNGNTRAKVVFRECMRRATKLSCPELAHLLGLDHSMLVISPWWRYADDVARVMAKMPDYNGRKVATVEQYLCPTCGHHRSVMK